MRHLVVGYGNIGKKRRQILGPRCAGTVDPLNPEAEFRRVEDCPEARYDAAILATPRDAKLGLLEHFLRRGKHVLVEKPMLFPDGETAARLESLARENGVIWYTSYNHRFEPLVAEMRSALDAGKIGAIYSSRLFYGNGTVRNVTGSWREQGLGVLEDLGCHLLDLAGWLLGARGSRVRIHELRPVESRGYDRFLMATEDGRIVMEGSYICWKNAFTIDIFGEKGSIHLNGLCKWGPSELVLRERVLPSGAPKETRRPLEGPDVTWERDLEHFEKLAAAKRFEPENDRWISGILAPVPGATVAPAGGAPTAFLGMSHLGLVCGIGWASLGRPVVAFDPDEALVSRLSKGDLPLHEPGLAETLAKHRSSVTFSSDSAALKSCPILILARDVPTDEDNMSSLEPVEEMAVRILPGAQAGATLVLMSQVPPGFTRRLRDRVRAARPDVEVIYQVETLVFGQALERCVKPERLILGCADPAAPLPPALEDALSAFRCPILRMGFESAELCKTAINLYLCSAVTYANTLSRLCEEIGADWSEIVPALRLDRRIGPSAYIKPGLGIAGGNLERDLVTVRDACRARGIDASFVEAILDYNERRYRWALEMAERHILSAGGKPTLAVWGLAYKKNTASTKNSRSLRVIRDLAGRARIRAYDPLVKEAEGVTICGRDEALQGADGLLIMTEWDEFGRVDAAVFRRMARPVVIDCVGVLPEVAGVRRYTPGRGP